MACLFTHKVTPFTPNITEISLEEEKNERERETAAFYESKSLTHPRMQEQQKSRLKRDFLVLCAIF